MNAGFYYTYWPEYGSGKRVRRYWRQVKKLRKVNVFMDYNPGFKSSIPKALPGRKLWADLGFYSRDRENPEHVRSVVNELRPWLKRGKVIALELGDEFDGPAAVISNRARMVRRVFQEEGLVCPPLQMTFKPDDVLFKSAWKAGGLDVVGIEAYLDFRAGEAPERAASRMAEFIDAQVRRVAPRRVTLVGLEARLGAWTDNAALVAVQKPIFEAAQRLDAEGRLLMLALFAWAKSHGATARGESAMDIGPLRAELKARLA